MQGRGRNIGINIKGMWDLLRDKGMWLENKGADKGTMYRVVGILIPTTMQCIYQQHDTLWLC